MINLMDILAHNTLLQTLIGASGVGAIIFGMKDFGIKLFNFIKQEFTTELVITSHHRIYHEVLSWIEKSDNKGFRKLKATNGRWGGGDNLTVSIGWGFHIIKYENTYLLINLNKESSNQTEYDKETMTITCLGRSSTVFKSLLREASASEMDDSKIGLYLFSDSWGFIRKIPKRALNTICMDREIKDTLLKTVDRFIKSEKDYYNSGIPYQLGILLYGPPGTGKSSLIRAVASHFDYPIYYLPVSKLLFVGDAFRNLPDNSLIVIEDIDTFNVSASRFSEGESEKSSIFGISDLLNSIDGIGAPHGRILFMTTNQIEKLDPALIRPGRIDHRVEMAQLTESIINDFMIENPKFKLDLSKQLITSKNC